MNYRLNFRSYIKLYTNRGKVRLKHLYTVLNSPHSLISTDALFYKAFVTLSEAYFCHYLALIKLYRLLLPFQKVLNVFLRLVLKKMFNPHLYSPQNFFSTKYICDHFINQQFGEKIRGGSYLIL